MQTSAATPDSDLGWQSLSALLPIRVEELTKRDKPLSLAETRPWPACGLLRATR